MDAYVVHSAGKVASTSIARALARVGLNSKGSRVFKTHILNEEGAAARTLRQAGIEAPHFVQSKEFLALLRKDALDRCCVILGQREPVAQALAWFFQNINRLLKKQEVTLADFDLVMAALEKEIPSIIKNCTVTWWHEEVELVFDVDFFALDFDRPRGITVFEQSQKPTFVLYTLERGIHHLPRVLENITGKKPIEIGVENTVTDDKVFKSYQNHSEIGRLYKKTLERFKLPLPVLEEIYQYPAPRFFYDHEQIAAFIERWRAPV